MKSNHREGPTGQTILYCCLVNQTKTKSIFLLQQELMSAVKECQTTLTICCRIKLSAKLQIWSKGRV